jgi:hypothetical protein
MHTLIVARARAGLRVFYSWRTGVYHVCMVLVGVCVGVCMYVYMFVCMYVYMCVCFFVEDRLNDMCTFLSEFLPCFVYVCVCVCM